MEKEPLGLKPEFIHNMQCNTERMADIIEAMKRYSEAEKPIPLKWITELERRVFLDGE